MFGFFGHAVGIIDLEANGEAASGLRRFQIKLGFKRVDLGKTFRGYFDTDDVNATKADNQYLISSTAVPYDSGRTMIGSASYNISAANILAGYVFHGQFQGNSNANTRGWSYSSIAVLTPVATRKTRYEFSRPEYLEQLIINPMGNNSSRTAASNNATGTLNLNLNQHKNLKDFWMAETWLSTLNLKFNNPILESFGIGENPTNIIISGDSLPASTKYISIGEMNGLTSINTLIQNCVNCETFNAGQMGGTLNLINALTTLTGTTDFSFMSNLKEFQFDFCQSLTTIYLPTGNTNWQLFMLTDMPTAAGSIPISVLDEILSASTLQVFAYNENERTLTKPINNSDISDSLIYFYIYNNDWSGNINFTTKGSTIREFKTGNQGTHTGIQQNVHSIVNITGLTSVLTIDLAGSEIDDLELPIGGTCTKIYLMDNNLDIVTNPNLIDQINTMTGLTLLYFAVNQTTTAACVGQNSTNGLGANVNLSGLTLITILTISNCKLTGTLTLPNSTDKIGTLSLFNNTGLTSILNLNNHSGSISTIRALDCNSLDLELSALTVYSGLNISKWQNTTINIGGRTSTANMNNTGGISIQECPNLTDIILPTSSTNFTFSGQRLEILNNTGLTGITNIGSFKNTVGTVKLDVQGNSNLNIAFPFSSTFIPNTTTVQNNALSNANVNTTIDRIYTGRSDFLSGTKSINIAGSNVGPSGTYQAPSGFVLDVSDGTPTSALEQIYVLVLNYDWTITYTDWSPLSLGSKLKIFNRFDDVSYLITASTKISQVDNIADDGATYWTQATDANRPVFNVTGNTAEFRQGAGNNWMDFSDYSIVSGDTHGEWNFIFRRKNTTVRAYPVTFSLASSSTASIMGPGHYTASDEAPSGGVQFRFVDDAATYNNVSYDEAETDTYRLHSFSSSGGTWYLYKNTTGQTLDVHNGTNTGEWQGDIAFDQMALGRRGGTSNYYATMDMRLIVYTNAPLTTEERLNLYDWAVAESLL